jgi:hypothetical protein
MSAELVDHHDLETLDLGQLSAILKKTGDSIRTDLCRNPHRVPPPLDLPGSRRLLWLRQDVLEWLAGCRRLPAVVPPQLTPPGRGPGRPRKSDQVRRRRAEELDGATCTQLESLGHTGIEA